MTTEFFDFEDAMQVLFPTHLLVRQHSDLGDFNARLQQVVLQREQQAQSQGDFTDDLWKGQDLLTWDAPEIRTLEALFVDMIQAYLASLNITQAGSFVLSAWANVRRDNSSHFWHAHPKHELVANYYVSVPEPQPGDASSGGALVLMDPRHGASACVLGSRQDYYHEIQPQPGLGVVFPGYMMHMVEPVRSPSPRISISCNATFGGAPEGMRRHRSGI